MDTLPVALNSFKASHSIADLGKTIQGKCFFIAYNKTRGWYFKEFSGLIGRIQLLLRSIFGCFGDTHLSHVAKQLQQECPKETLRQNSDLCTLHRTLKNHWHRAQFPWEIDLCINCYARERFKEANGVTHPFCGKTCAGQFKQQPSPIPQSTPVQQPNPIPQSNAVQQSIPVQQPIPIPQPIPTQHAAPDIVPGYSCERLRTELTAYARRGHVDFYEVRYKPLTSIFGNFHPCRLSIPLNGQNYSFQCSEAAFQAYKFEARQDLIRQFETLDGDGAFRKARTLQSNVNPYWMHLNVQAMKAVLHAKFTQNPELGQLLLATGNAVLVEHTARDKFWGDGGDGSGQNKLGVLLMELRTQLGGPQMDFNSINYRAIAAQL